MLPGIVSLIVLIGTVTYFYFSSKTEFLHNSEVLISNATKQYAEKLEFPLMGQEMMFFNLTREDIFGYVIEFNATIDFHDEITRKINSMPGVLAWALVTLDGTVVDLEKSNQLEGYANDLIGQKLPEFEYYNRHDTTIIHYGWSPMLSRWGAQYPTTTVFCYPTKSTSGEKNGYFMAFMDFAPIHQLVKDCSKTLADYKYDQACVYLLFAQSNEVAASVEAGDNVLTDADLTLLANYGMTHRQKQTTIINELNLSRGGAFVCTSAIGTEDPNSPGMFDHWRPSLVTVIPDEQVLAGLKRNLFIDLGIGAGLFILLLGLNRYTARRISRRINRISSTARAMSIGEVDHNLAATSNDELGDLAVSFAALRDYLWRLAHSAEAIADNNLAIEIPTMSESDVLGQAFAKMLHNFRTMVQQIKSDAAALLKISQRIGTASEQLSEGATLVYGSINTSASASEEISTNMNVVASAVKENSLHIEELSTAAANMSSSVKGVSSAVHEISSAMDEVTRNSDATASIAGDADRTARSAKEKMDSLAANARAIDKIVGSITDIADQTNLLALNAAIEAASAGEAGRGFAVVANEVKELAKQTAMATAEITSQVRSMQSDTDEAVEAIAKILEVTEQINSLSAEVAHAIENQSTAINNISGSISGSASGAESVSNNARELAHGTIEISRSVDETSSGATGIARNVARTANVTENMNVSIRDLSDIALTLNGQAEGLTGLVAQFDLGSHCQHSEEKTEEPILI